MFSLLKEECRCILKRDPALRHPMEALLCSPGLRAQLRHRRAHRAYLQGRFLHARLISHRTRRLTGIEIHPGATLGRDLLIDHGMGIVIGETAVIGDHVTLFHGVTLGATAKPLPPGHTKRHPTVGDHVLIGANASILGDITIGHHARIGANAVVLASVPPYATAVGNPARIIRKNANSFALSQEVNHADLQQPDP